MSEQILELIRAHSPLADFPGSIDAGQYVSHSLNDQVIGCVKVVKVSWYLAEVSHLVVAPEHRRQGNGRRLVSLACKRARALRARVAQCTIHTDNQESARVFAANGFQAGITFTGKTGRALTVWQRSLTHSRECTNFGVGISCDCGECEELQLSLEADFN